MGFLVSPGVEVKEIDLTNVIPALSTSIGAFAGHFNWGPGNQVVTVGSEKDLATIYGKPTTDVAQSFFTAASFLKYANTLRVSRAIPATARNAKSGVGTLTVPISNLDEFESADFGEAFLGRYPGALGNSIEVQVGYGDFNDYSSSLFAENFDAPSGSSEFNTNLTGINPLTDEANAGADEIHVLVIDKAGKFTGIPGSVLESFASLSLASNAKAADGASIYYKDVINTTSAYIYTGSLDSIFSGADELITTDSVDLFELTTASGFTTPGTATVPGVLITTTSENFGGVIVEGDPITTNPDISFFANWSDPLLGENTTLTFVRSGDVNDGVIVSSVITDLINGFVAFTITYGTLATLADIKLAIDTHLDAEDFDEDLISIEVDGIKVILTPVAPATELTVDQIRVAEVKINQGLSNTRTYEFIGAATAPTYKNFELSNGVTGTADDAEIVAALDYFADPDLIDINLVFAETFKQGSSTYTGTQAQNIDNAVIAIANGRKDCVGFISAPLDLGTLRTDADKKTYVLNKFNVVTSSSYLVFDSTPIYTYNKYTDTYLYIAAAGHMAGLCAYTDKVADTWFSPAGFNRGQLLGTTKIAYNPKQADRDDLYKARINPIVTFPGQGTLLYGDKTGQAKASAFDRINVRRLFITLEKSIATAAKYQLFELNDEFTRAMFRNMVEPFLRDVKGRRGITDFLVVCDSTNNTGEVIDGNRFVADIYIKPARSINFITLNFIATRTGVEFNEIVGK
jgi:hypothetical protein